jgi:hypothetical protein
MTNESRALHKRSAMNPRKNVRKLTVCIWSAVAAIGVAGCFQSPFLRTDGPAQAQGVSVALVDQRCDFEPDWDAQRENGSYPNRLDIGMKILVDNQTPHPITIDGHNLRLLAGGDAVAPMTAGEPRSVAPGGKETIEVRFQHTGDSGCNAQLSLSLDKAIRVGDQPVPLRAVTFVAKASES